MAEFLINALVTIAIVGLGGLLLLAGRTYLWVLLGVGGLIITAAAIAELRSYPDMWAIIRDVIWIPLLISISVGALGVYLAKTHRKLAIDVIGFGAGVFVATWFDEIFLALSGRTQDESTWWMALILLAAGIIGIWLTRQDPEGSLILISVIIGVYTISSGLNLDRSSSLTAVLTLGLALTGVVVQYASYLREHPRIGRQLPPVPHPVNEELPF